jgi:peptide/nickel transport system substrate-binding protein
MDRRDFLKATAGVAALAGTGGLSAPALAQSAAARTLRFVPQANLANFDPIWGTQYVVRNAACPSARWSKAKKYRLTARSGPSSCVKA